MIKRIKITQTPILTRDAVEQAVGLIAGLKNDEARMKADMDAELQAVRDDYAADLAGIAVQIERELPRVMAWAETNLDAFGKAKSLEMTHGIVGWKTGNPTVRTLAGFDLGALEEGYPLLVRTKKELDKEAVLTAHRLPKIEGGLDDADLRKLSLKVTQAETFFVEPKLTKTEPRESLKS